MSAAILLKIFSDCCICFAILGSGPVVFAIPLLLPAALCGICAGLASFFDRKNIGFLRCVCGILALGCVLLAEDWTQALILAVPSVYTCFVILRGKLELEYYEYRRFFLRSLAVVGGAFVAMHVWIFLTQIASEPVTILNPSVTLRYGLVHLLCGIVLQRQLRLGYSSQSNRRQTLMLLSSAVVMILSFLLAEPLLREGASALLWSMVTVMVTPFVLLFELIAWLLSLTVRNDSDKKTYEEFVEYIESIGLGAGSSSGQAPPEAGPAGIDPTAIWVILVVIFLVIAAVVLIRSFKKLNLTAEPGEVVSRVQNVPKKKKTPTFTNRGKVRQIYRDFLRSEKNMGMKLLPNHTSQDVLDQIHPKTNRPGAQQLRQLYLSARYDTRQGITREQVEQAKRALKSTRPSQ